MSESLNDPNLKNIEAAFRALTPATPSLARDRLLYEAGRRAASRHIWPALTGVLAVTTAMLGWHVAVQPDQAVQIVYLPAPIAPSRSETDVLAARLPQVESAPAGIFSLLLLGAPDFLPARPAHTLAIEESLGAPVQNFPADAGFALPSRDRFGLPPGSLGNPPKRPNDFGPIQRGDV
jgi:hypothetical protein